MKNKLPRFVFIAGAIMAVAGAVAGEIPLFDGKTLDGWETVDRDKPFWRAENGVIMADSLGKKMPRNTFLFSKKQYANFEFRCKFRLTGDPKTGLVNSGIQFRTAKHGKGNAIGYQADIGEPNWWGCLYDEHRRGLIAKSDVNRLRGTLKPFGWNDYLIRAQGPVITLFINGIQTIQYVEKDPKIPSKGHFALQLHGGGICRMEYKDIKLTLLTYDATKAPPPAEAPPSTKKAPPPAKAKLAEGEVMFEDFESGIYKGWITTGTAFGTGPVEQGKVPSYQGDLFAKGSFCVNSHASATGTVHQRDGETGTLTSAPFKITHDYVRLLVGGGGHKDRTCVNVIIDNRHVVASVTGDNDNRMSERSFDLRKYKGKMAKIQFVDAVSSGWGNIGGDNIVFTNLKPKKTKQTRKVGKKTQSGRTGAYTPEKQLAGFTVPEGFVVELVASEKDGVINPIDLTFDDSGRLWSNTARMYPMDPNPKASWGQTLKYMDNPGLQWADERFRKVMDLYKRKTKGQDQILIIEDPAATPTKATVWADGLSIPQSFLPYKNGAFVAHGSEMLFLEDTNNDGKADKWNTVLSGFGYTDTHTMAHLLIRAPGGWAHYGHGALNKGDVVTTKTGERDRVDFAKIARFSLDGMKHDVIVSGLNNIWGYHLRGNGQWFGSEANDHGHSVTPMEPGTGYNGIGNARIRPYQPMLPPPNNFRVGGTGLSGLAFSDNSAEGFPSEWRNVGFLANPISCTINAVRIIRNPDGSITSELLEDLLQSEDDWFRPVNLEFGPDGCLYVADFYNKIISHNEVSREHPDRDKAHGRIWRIRYLGAKPPKPVNFLTLPTAQLPGHLKAPILWAKRAAWHQIVDRGAKELALEVAKICADASQDETTRIIALWSLEGLKHYDRTLMATLLKSDLPDLRREAVRALGSMPVLPNELATLLKPFITETHVMVRSQVLRTFADYGRSNPQLIDLVVSFCLPDTKSEKLGGDYERKFERYLARMALEQYPKELDRYLNSPLAAKQPESHLAWAEQALSIDDRAKKFLARWTSIKDQPLGEDDFRIACGLLRSTQVQAALKPLFDAPEADALVALAKKHALDVASPVLGKLLQPACERMLQSGNTSRAMAAAVAADRLNVEGLGALLAEALTNRLSDADFVTATVNVLARKAQAHPASFKAVLQQDKLGAQASMTALAALASIDPAAAKSFAGSVAGKLSPMAHAALAHRLTESAAGAKLLLDLLDDGNIAKSVVDRALAERIGAKAKNDKRAKALLQSQHTARAAQVKTFKTKLETFMHVAEQKGGDPAKGKPVFTAICLSCHAVGGQGAGFAPALDGAAHRETEHLLTAILDPDAAVEGNYALYRIFKRDGDAIEGYLEEENARGTTLRLMGGGKLFVSRDQIASAGFLNGRSVMPRGLIDGFDKQQLADLLAYVRTLK